METMMKYLPRPDYRALFWAASCVALAAVALSYHIRSLAVTAVGDPRFFRPHRLSELRDVRFPFTVEVYGYKYRGRTGDYIDDHILAFGAYEKDVLFFMRDYTRARNNPDAVFLDVGACEGQHSLFMSRLVKQVHAFEPFPTAAGRFRELVELNGFTNIQLHEVGLGASEALVPFFAPGQDNQGVGTFSPGRAVQPGRTSGSFRVVAGDDWLGRSGVGPVDLIKIDVEGYEGLVIQGLSATLRRDRPVMVIEVSRPPEGTIDSLGRLGSLVPSGYRFLKIHEGGDIGGPAIDGKYELSKMTQLFPPGSGLPSRVVMVVAYPEEREALVLGTSRLPGTAAKGGGARDGLAGAVVDE